MKKIILLLGLIVLIIGCSPGKLRDDRPQMSDEQREKMFEQRTQNSINACKDKSEGDICEIQGFRPKMIEQEDWPVMKGTCKMQEDILRCFFDRPIFSDDKRPEGDFQRPGFPDNFHKPNFPGDFDRHVPEKQQD
ncbi:hypothetical protein KY314_02060 [Candidatus Woesearchaeota archaeon]|nr:hypothetical protein [Candidatus Woesearchaeota archaeon]